MLSNELLERAIALKVAADADAAPRAQQILTGLLAGTKPAECPQSATDPPDTWPFRQLGSVEARRLLWCIEALPTKAGDLLALW